MTIELDPDRLSSDQIRHELAIILAASLRRLRDRRALLPTPPDFSFETPANRLEAVPANPLTDHVG